MVGQSENIHESLDIIIRLFLLYLVTVAGIEKHISCSIDVATHICMMNGSLFTASWSLADKIELKMNLMVLSCHQPIKPMTRQQTANGITIFMMWPPTSPYSHSKHHLIMKSLISIYIIFTLICSLQSL